jgi:hypothetical protein
MSLAAWSTPFLKTDQKGVVAEPCVTTSIWALAVPAAGVPLEVLLGELLQALKTAVPTVAAIARNLFTPISIPPVDAPGLRQPAHKPVLGYNAGKCMHIAYL